MISYIVSGRLQAFEGMVLLDAVAGEMQPNFTNSQKSMYIQSYNWL